MDATSGSIDGFPSYGLGLNHFSLNKFSGPDDYYYETTPSGDDITNRRLLPRSVRLAN